MITFLNVFHLYDFSWLWFISLGLILIFAFLFFWGERSKKKHLNQINDYSQQNSELRLRSLQMQMNPHFIFNSLTSLQDLIIAKDTQNALLYLSMWASVIRINLENVLEEYIRLTDEIDFLMKFSEMEKLKFNGKLEINFFKKVEDESVVLPPMLIQPLIENAIKHGLNNLSREGKINVTFESNKSSLIIIVEDNGIGRAEALKLINKEKNGLGLGIIEQRLVLLNKKFKSNANQIEIIDLNSLTNQSGTRVIIRLMLIRDEGYKPKITKLRLSLKTSR